MHIPAHGSRGRRAARTAVVALSALAVTGGGTVAHAAAVPASPAYSAPYTNGAVDARPAANDPTGVPATISKKGLLSQGDSGPKVKALQSRLLKLGYWIDSADGEFGGNTKQAVYAVQKAAGLGRDGVVGPQTQAALDKGVRPKATSTKGRVIEIDLKRQLLLVVDNGKVRQILSTSTGSGKPYTQDGKKHTATTPKGDYKVFRGVDKWDPGPLGKLYRPKYFNGGIAVHGYGSVPPYPASHGCARVSLAAMDWLWKDGRMSYGTIVRVR
ncbi:peptidoglycan hydrolase-like protein with peptidoglycan-binding domain [Murinocardiopsis flavida]|uniref:Peptidoglycan hydrolase-like protein with peptidoglycan-binding domain n=1 Tax=Murinocardiopsis flavida TaxID=645275 RepID=A0A2P8CZX7_9ACTN|nr:L,D-transpeptidase family protein [Murinocardiopsis flavida]PSK90514.1 peptidoglycan hydrolase-like protein with peptidoglycan-binding domain [Murinocardiopsis flavida]